MLPNQNSESKYLKREKIMLYQKSTYAAIACLSLLLLCSPSQAEQEKTAVFIIGMGRSGSSCTAGVLKIMGMEMGSPLAPPGQNNKKGKFEHLPTNLFMQPILKKIDAIWWNPRLLDWATLQHREELKDQVKAHLAKHFGEFHFFGIKNPEITILLPLFTQAAQELGYTPKIIMVLRHPDETNASLQKDLSSPKKNYYRNISIAYACAFKNAQGFDMHVVYFDDLIYKTEKTVTGLKTFLPQLKEYKEVEKELTQFIDDGLKHHNAKK